MKGLDVLNPMIINPDYATKCDLLCNLQCSYSHGDIQYVFNESGNIYFSYDGKNSVDVHYNNAPYSLKKIYISGRRHQSYPVDKTIVGECCFFHEGKSDNLVISIFLRTTRGFSQSQDFFAQFLNIDVGTQNIRETINITTSPDWSPQQAIPQKTAFFTYVRENTRFVVLTEPVFIDHLNFEKIERMNVNVPSELEKQDKERLYYHPKVTTNPRMLEEKKKKCNKKIDFGSLDPHKNCESDLDNPDFPEKYEGESYYEDHSTAAFTTIVFILFSFFIIRGPLLLGLTGNFKHIIKFLRSGIWLLIFFTYFYIANPITIFLFFFVALYGMLLEKIGIKDKFEPDTDNNETGNDKDKDSRRQKWWRRRSDKSKNDNESENYTEPEVEEDTTPLVGCPSRSITKKEISNYKEEDCKTKNKKVLILHPDKNPTCEDESNEKMQLLNNKCP